MILEHPLSCTTKINVNLGSVNSDEARRLARFWVGKNAPTRKDAALYAVQQAMQNEARVKEQVLSLPYTHHQVLSIVKRYGGTIDGAILKQELLARKIIAPQKPNDYQNRQADPVWDLQERFLLLRNNPHYSSWEYRYNRVYPNLTLFPGIEPLVSAAPPLIWEKEALSACNPERTFSRSMAQVALELVELSETLAEMDRWKVNKGGASPVSLQTKLKKRFGNVHPDPLMPNDPELLLYELLIEMGAVQIDEQTGLWKGKPLQQYLEAPMPIQARALLRGWISITLWQDGIGAVPDRDNNYDLVRIEPSALLHAKKLLVWTLCQVAHQPNEWLDLEGFLKTFWGRSGEQGIDFYWNRYSFLPHFDMAKKKDSYPVGPEREYAFFLDSEGLWFANALLVTLVYLGLIERGVTGNRYSFRFTELGRAVFGAPEVIVPPMNIQSRFLTVQPNYELVAHLEHASVASVWCLGRIARRQSPIGSPVAVYKLTRESVYEAQEGGFSLLDIQQFLSQYSEKPLPGNVEHALIEWSRKRDALSVRSNLLLGAFDRIQTQKDLCQNSGGRAVGEHFALFPMSAHQSVVKRMAQVANANPWDFPHGKTARFKIDEQLRIQSVEKERGVLDLITQTRLNEITEPDEMGFRIDREKVEQARRRGIGSEIILRWLNEFIGNKESGEKEKIGKAGHSLPPLVRMVIRNWAGRPIQAFSGELVVLQISDKEGIEAVITSERFRPFLIGLIAPDCILVQRERQDELNLLLQALGFATAPQYKVS